MVGNLIARHLGPVTEMSPSKGTAWAVAGVSIGILGLAISLLGQAFALGGGPNIGPEAFIGIAIAAVGMLMALLAASSIRE